MRNSTQEERWLLWEKYFGVDIPAYEDDKARLARGEPLAYVIGFVPFLNLKIDVSFRPHIPRVETEFWTEKVIEILKTDTRESIRCLDLFSGSGCVGLAIAKNVPNVYMDLADNDPKCIEQIEKNISLNTIDTRRVRVLCSDLFSRVCTTYDYIFANPPYIALKNIGRVAVSVLQFEPHEALFGGDDGLAVIRPFLAEALSHLSHRGRIYMEFDDIEYKALQMLCATLSCKSVCFSKDQYNLWRFVELAV